MDGDTLRNELMKQDGEPLSGEVEVDETRIGGKLRNVDRRKAHAERPGQRPYTYKARAVVFFHSSVKVSASGMTYSRVFAMRVGVGAVERRGRIGV